MDYAIYTILSLGLSFLVFQLVLRQQKTFGFNRFFLLASLLCCLLAPLTELNVFNSVPRIHDITSQFSEEKIIIAEDLEGITVETLTANSFGFFDALLGLYIAISLCFLFRLLGNLYRIAKHTKSTHVQYAGLKLIKTEEDQEASSFFKYVFIPSEVWNNKELFNNIIQHESAHYKQAHVLDIICVELLLCVFWFNPFLWFYKSAILQNHEYLADVHVINSGIAAEAYSKSIIYSTVQKYRMPLASGFNFKPIKNRILMLQKSKSSVLKRSLKISAALLLLSGIFMISSFETSTKPLLVVVDVAHGGHDSGNSMEKDVVLSIANYLAAYSNDDLKIVFTRTSDQFLSLKERVDFINQQKPDVMISLHCNAHSNVETSGVEAFYYPDNKHQETAYNYSKILIANQLGLFSQRGEIKNAGFYVLKNTDAPSVVLELGFITNAKDRATLTDKKQQQAIAKNLYESLLNIQKNR